MRPILSRKFIIRFYECDMDGFLHHATYARLMQEAAIDASAAVGWDGARYESIGKQWIVHTTNLDYYHPITVNDKIEITTWVEDFRRVRSLRIYEFRKENNGDLLARAVTDWVLIDTKTLRPTQPPTEMIADFYPDYQNESSQFRGTFPAQPTLPQNTSRIEKQVEWRDVDQLGHLNNGAYFDYLDTATHQAFSMIGWGRQAQVEAEIRLIAAQQRIKYNQPAQLDDVVEIKTWSSSFTDETFLQHYLFTRQSDQAILAYAQTNWKAISSETNQPIALPQALSARF